MTQATDRELLEAAARAAGFEEAEWQDMSGWGEARYGLSEAIWTGDDYFNPLVDDGEALRLAVKLNIRFAGEFHSECVALHGLREFREPSGDNPLAATRRAIVRAAAAVGGMGGEG